MAIRILNAAVSSLSRWNSSYDSLLERTEDFPKCVKRQTSGHFFHLRRPPYLCESRAHLKSSHIYTHTHVSKCSRHGQKLLLTAPDTSILYQYCCQNGANNGCIQLQKITIITTPFGMVAAEFYSIFSK